MVGMNHEENKYGVSLHIDESLREHRSGMRAQVQSERASKEYDHILLNFEMERITQNQNSRTDGCTDLVYFNGCPATPTIFVPYCCWDR